MVEKSKLDEDKEGKAARPYRKSTYNAVLNKDLSVSKEYYTSGTMVSKDSSIALNSFADAIMLVVQIQPLAFWSIVDNGVIDFTLCNTELSTSRHLTKLFGEKNWNLLDNKLGMRSFTPETLKQLADEVDE
ncbi:hypothetical protein Tco_0509368 [Tanacetum coccineum]